MLEPRFGCSVVAHQGKIYVSGGYGHDKAILSSTECYDPLTGRTNLAIFFFSRIGWAFYPPPKNKGLLYLGEGKIN